MIQRPYTVLSCAISLDGCLDWAGPSRLVLSGPEDLDRVDAQRAAADAILVGAGTIRRDDPRLLIRSPSRRAARRAAGRPEHPAGVTVTTAGDLDPGARFFTREPGPDGPPGRADAQRLVYTAGAAVAGTRARLGETAEVAGAGDPPRLEAVLADLAGRGVERLLVEGGARLGAEILARGLADELHLVIAPFLVGDPAAPRFAGPGRYPGTRFTLAEACPVGEVVLLRYLAPGRPGGPAPRAGVGQVPGG
jgi:riboflavin-specific deaminase-like protein